MNLVVKARKVTLPREDEAYISRRAAFAFSRYDDDINSLTVIIADNTEPTFNKL